MPIDLDIEEIAKLVRSIDQGQAAGPCGKTGDHLAVEAKDRICLRGICDLILDMIKGKITGRARLFLITAIQQVV
jgi:hypothetical protein